MPTTDDALATTLQNLFGLWLGSWVSAPARGGVTPERLAAVWWRGQLVLFLTRLRRDRVPADLASFVLALHLHGAALQVLAEVSGLDDGQLCRLVQEARRRTSSDWTPPCSDGADLVARWRDLASDPEERRLLLAHASRCPACRAALAASRAADERFLGAVAADRPAPQHRPQQRLVAVLAVLTALGVLVGIAFPLLRHQPAAPASGAAVPASGPFLWLGSSGPYSIAFDLGQRSWIPVTTQFPADAGSYRLLSPDGERLAAWTPDPPREPRWLDVLDLTGTRRARWRWDRTTLRRPLAWLDSERLLVRETPVRAPYERDAEFLERLQRASRLLRFESSTSQETLLFAELVADAVPAPDGETFAFLRALETAGPGATTHTLDLVVPATDGKAIVLARLDGVVAGARPLWFPDSSRVVVARRPDGTTQLPTPTELVVLDRSGRLTVLVPARPGLAFSPLAIAPDASRLFYSAVPLGQHERLDIWEFQLATGESHLVLRLDRASGPLTVFWANGEPLLLVVRTLPVPPSTPQAPEVTELYRWTGRDAECLGTAPGRWGFDAWGQPLVAVRPHLPQSFPTVPLPPGQVASGTLRLAPGGRWLLAPATPDGLALWDAATGIQLSEPWALDEPSWHPAGMGFVAVGTDGRLRLVSRSLDGIWQPDVVLLDDARRAGDLWAAVGPDGRLAAASRTGDETLVLWTSVLPTTTVLHRWRPGELSGLPCATWQRAGTLLLALPLPGGFLEVRSLVITGEGVVERRLARYRPFRGRTVDRCWLASAPTQRWVALRARSGGSDTILAAPLDDPAHPLVLATGPHGSGLAWTPDGTRLAYGLGTTLAVTDQRGRDLLRVTALVSDLVWIDDTTLWGMVPSDARAEVVSWRLPRRATPRRQRSRRVA